MQGQQANVRGLLRRTIYQLKYRYGYPIDLYRNTKGAYDTKTGQYAFTTEKVHVGRAIIMPSTTQRSFFFSISVIQANSRFIQGADIQLSDRQVIVDGNDLPKGWIINIDDYFIWDNERYDIKVSEGLQDRTGYVLSGRKIQGAKLGAIYDQQIADYQQVFDSFGVKS